MSVLQEENVLQEAEKVVYGDREKTYGAPAENVDRARILWSEVLGVRVTRDQFCLCMMALKMARLIHDPLNHDSLVDLCGYAALMDRMQKEYNP